VKRTDCHAATGARQLNVTTPALSAVRPVTRVNELHVPSGPFVATQTPILAPAAPGPRFARQVTYRWIVVTLVVAEYAPAAPGRPSLEPMETARTPVPVSVTKAVELSAPKAAVTVSVVVPAGTVAWYVQV
jgi:hypothetical protein